MKKKKPYIIEYRRSPNFNGVMAELFSKKWKKFKSYTTESGRDKALEAHQRNCDFLEFRIPLRNDK